MKNLIVRRIYIGVAVLGVSFCGNAQGTHLGKLAGNAARGKAEYGRYCAGCHGVRGDGKGSFAPYLDPRPRDFIAAIYKFRSTPTGTLPTDKDLFDTMTRGIITTAMPYWAPLGPQTRLDLISYVKQFSPRFTTETPGVAIEIPVETPVSGESALRGAKLYASLECATCHGIGGHGDGPKALLLVDSKNQPNPPYDFTAFSRFKCGSTDEALYTTLMTGVDGTSMPAYLGKATPEEIWDVIHFVRTLQTGYKKH